MKKTFTYDSRLPNSPDTVSGFPLSDTAMACTCDQGHPDSVSWGPNTPEKILGANTQKQAGLSVSKHGEIARWSALAGLNRAPRSW